MSIRICVYVGALGIILFEKCFGQWDACTLPSIAMSLCVKA